MADVELDCQGLLCPLPVLRAGRALRAMQPGQTLAVVATDPMAAIDLPHFCTQTGHEFLGPVAGAALPTFVIRCRAAGRAP